MSESGSMSKSAFKPISPVLFSPFCLFLRTAVCFLLFFVLALAPSNVFSQLLDQDTYDQLIRTLEPVEATVVSVSEDGSITLSYEPGCDIHQGDLFTIYERGRPVSDPETGQKLGFLRRPIALVQVASVKKSSCRCRVLTSKSPVLSGFSAIRYEDVKAFFTSRTDHAAAVRLRKRLMRDLPYIVWAREGSRGTQAKNALTFVLEARRLDLYGPGKRLLRSFPLSMPVAEKPEQPKRHIAKPAGSIPPVSFNPTGLRWKKARPLGLLSAGALQVMVFDLAGDGDLQTIYLTNTGLYVYPFRDHGVMAAYRFQGPGVPQGFSCCSGMVVLNILMPGIGMRSVLLRYTGSQLVTVQDDINLWLSFVDRDGDGVAESLLAQGFGLETGFAHDVYLAEPDAGGIYYRGRLNLPALFNVTRSLWCDLNGNGKPELVTLVSKHELRIYESGNLLSTIDLKLLPGDVPSQFTRLISFDVNGDGRREVIFGGSNGPEGHGRILALFWSGARYSVSTVSLSVKGSICGLSFDGKGRLLAAVVRQDEKERRQTLLYLLE